MEQPETPITEELSDEPKIKKKKKKKDVNSSEVAEKSQSSGNIEVAGDELNNSSKKSKKRKSPDHLPLETQPKKRKSPKNRLLSLKSTTVGASPCRKGSSKLSKKIPITRVRQKSLPQQRRRK